MSLSLGFNCNKLYPDLSNICTSNDIGDNGTYKLPNFCTGTVGFQDTRETFCRRIGGNDENGNYEWDYDSINYDICPVFYSEANNGISNNGPGCCGFDCTVPGFGVNCKRVRYNGDPFNCCLRDLAYNISSIYCYDDNTQKSTCSPNYRNITNNDCQDLLINFCIGSDLNLATDMNILKDRWINPNQSNPNVSIPTCQYFMNRMLFTNPNTPGLFSGTPINPSLFNNKNGFIGANNLITKLFNSYSQAGYQIGSIPGFSTYDNANFQSDVLFPICSTIPGLCSDSLTSICGSQTTDTLITQPSLVPWCGCYMNNIEYQQYQNDFQINKECTPMCSRQGNLPLSNTSGYGVKLCQQSVCIIDDVTLSLESSQIGGNINFSQFCGACSGQTNIVGSSTSLGSSSNTSVSTCQCILNGLNIDVVNSTIGGNINIQNICGPSTTCYQNDTSNGSSTLIQVPCDAGPNYNPNNDPNNIAKQKKAQEEHNKLVYTIIFFIILFIIIIIILYNY